MKLFTFFTILFVSTFVTAQDNPQVELEKELELVITTFFDAMRDSDTTTLQSLFDDPSEATLSSTYLNKKTNRVKIVKEEVPKFIEAVARPRTEIWDERVSNLSFNIDDRMANVWMDYSFYIDNKFSHCGVNSFLLVLQDEGWKIISITDSRRRNECKEITTRD